MRPNNFFFKPELSCAVPIIENPSHMLLAEQSELSISVREKDALDFIGIVFKSPIGTTVHTGC